MLYIMEIGMGIWDVQQDGRVLASITQEAGVFEVQWYAKTTNLRSSTQYATFAAAQATIWGALNERP